MVPLPAPPGSPASGPPASRPPAPRPREAATLILWRRAGGSFEVLMGERHHGHRFMPGQWVFPGGRMERADLHLPAFALRDETRRVLEKAAPPRRAHGLAVAAIRETAEEVGLMIGRPSPDAARLPDGDSWAGFRAAGLLPALDALDYLGRAITPPLRPQRFHARFFLAPAGAAVGEARPSRELVRLAWVPLPEARHFDLPVITQVMLAEVARRLAEDARDYPVHAMRHGRRVVSYDR